MNKADIEKQKVTARNAEEITLESLLEEVNGESLKDVADKNLDKYVNTKLLYDMQD